MIIGIDGHINSGKTTVGDILVKYHGFMDFALADYMKEMAVQVFNKRGITHYHVKDREGKKEAIEPFYIENRDIAHIVSFAYNYMLWPAEYIETDIRDGILAAMRLKDAHTKITNGRHLLQILGTEICKPMFGQDFWVKSVFNQISELKKKGFDRFCITDARFINERNYIKVRNGYNIFIQTKEKIEMHNHQSELEHGSPEDYDYIIHNDKVAIAELEKKVKLMVEHFNILGAKAIKE